MKRPDALVIGAGFAGLAAATAMAEAGATVHVLEARPGLGGRATAFRDPVTGERIDNGQHVLAGCYSETLSFLERIGSASRLHRRSTLRVPMIDEAGRRSALVLPPLPTPLNLIAGVLAWDALPLSDRLAVWRLGPAFQGKTPPAAHLTVRQWLEQHRQSPLLCRMLWEPLALAVLNQSVDDAAATSFVAVLSRMFGSAPDAATLLVPAVPLDDLYAHPACQFLRAAGSTVATGSPAHLVIDGSRLVGVRVGDQLQTAAVVVSAVPWFSFATLAEPWPAPLEAVMAAAAALGSSPIVTVNLWLDREATDELMLGLPGRTFQWVFDRRRVAGASQTHLSLVSSGADAICAASNHDAIATAVRELRAALPTMAGASVRHASVVRERRATFSLKPDAPMRPGTQTAVAGLFLAGDWTDTGLPATIEGAVVSGHRAARAALAFMS